MKQPIEIRAFGSYCVVNCPQPIQKEEFPNLKTPTVLILPQMLCGIAFQFYSQMQANPKSRFEDTGLAMIVNKLETRLVQSGSVLSTSGSVDKGWAETWGAHYQYAAVKGGNFAEICRHVEVITSELSQGVQAHAKANEQKLIATAQSLVTAFQEAARQKGLVVASEQTPNLIKTFVEMLKSGQLSPTVPDSPEPKHVRLSKAEPC